MLIKKNSNMLLFTKDKEKNTAFISLVNKLIALGIWGGSEKSDRDSNSNAILNKFIAFFTNIYMIYHVKYKNNKMYK